MLESSRQLSGIEDKPQFTLQAPNVKVRLVQSTEVIKAQENERQRIASELHDGIGQRLSALKYSVENLLTSTDLESAGVEPLKKIIGNIRDSIEEVRRISRDLRPAILEDFGILVTIDWLCRDFQENHSIKMKKIINIQESSIGETQKIVIFRVIQEALNNITKHADARNVSIELTETNSRILLQIEDDGKGFRCNKKLKLSELATKIGIGLNSMRNRVELSNGNFDLFSVVGLGTKIQVAWAIS